MFSPVVEKEKNIEQTAENIESLIRSLPASDKANFANYLKRKFLLDHYNSHVYGEVIEKVAHNHIEKNCLTLESDKQKQILFEFYQDYFKPSMTLTKR